MPLPYFISGLTGVRGVTGVTGVRSNGTIDHSIIHAIQDRSEKKCLLIRRYSYSTFCSSKDKYINDIYYTSFIICKSVDYAMLITTSYP